MKYFSILFFFVFMCSPDSHAAGKKNFSVIGSYNSLSNISNEPETTPIDYPAHQEINLNIYLKPSWQLQVISANSTSDNYAFYGFGFRIQTPGVFLFGSKDATTKGHRRPFDTSVHAELMRMFDRTVPNLNTNFYVSRAGLTFDWMLFKSETLFLSTDISTFLIRSDLFIKTSIGIGIEI